MRGLQSTPRQLSLPVGESEALQRVWESMGEQARERVLRVLAMVIARLVSDGEERR